MINFGVWQLPDTPFGNAPGGRVPPESRPTSPKSRHICHRFYLYKTVSEVFDLKATTIRIWFRGRFDDIEQERSDDSKAAEHRRTCIFSLSSVGSRFEYAINQEPPRGLQ